MIPIGPDFQDPVSSPEYAPKVQELTPPFYSTVSIAHDEPQQFSVIASDLNTGDSLYWEWVLDYPPYLQGTTKIVGGGTDGPPASGPQIRTIPLLLDCGAGVNPNGPTQHQLELIVGDRPLTDDYNTQTLGIPAKGGLTDTASWTVTFNCQVTGSS